MEFWGKRGPGWDTGGGGVREREVEVGGCRGERAKEATAGSRGQKSWRAGSRVNPQTLGPRHCLPGTGLWRGGAARSHGFDLSV